MICSLCRSFMKDADKKSLQAQGVKYYLHKKCLRGATRDQLIEKGLIKPDDNGWWTKLGGE